MSGATVRIRKDVWKLPDGDRTLEWYARAVADMQTRPASDPTSWRYQAFIHGYDPRMDPFARPGEPMPTAADQRRFWSQCQHSSWFFLPWHRMYLHYFEQIVAATVVKLCGPADWSLPYWNYSDASNPNARLLPSAFLADSLSDGNPNALKVNARNPNENGDFGITDDEVSLACLRDSVFTGTSQGAHPGFGGPRTVFNHGGGPVGGLEQTPHGDIHVAVGGFMGAFETAGLDPIFWLHHANIDRLWEVWLGRDSRFTNPTDNRWRDAQGATFAFHDATGAIVTMVPRQVLDTTAAPLSYRYEDVSDPLAGQPALLAASMAMTDSERPAELVGATDTPVALPAGPTTARVAIQTPTGPAALAAGGHRRTLLHIENVTGRGRPTGYSVYLNVPDGTGDPHQHRELFAGTLPMFGVAEASRPDSQHGGSGLTYVLDITDLADRLRQQGRWDANDLRVTFAPRHRVDPSTAIQVGRISLYYR